MSFDVLVVNAGSSSIKFAVYHAADYSNDTVQLRQRGAVDNIGARARLRVSTDDATLVDEALVARDRCAVTHDDALARILAWLAEQRPQIDLRAAGHRVVHGGDRFAQPVRIDSPVLAYLRTLNALAPLHQPHCVAAIESLARQHPGLAQVACFDTAFHQSQPSVAREFGLPRALTAAGIKRYGFHGLSFESIARALPQHLGAAADSRVIVAHLGHGASLCAIHRRQSVATTMGFTPLDGLVMSTRCGTLDPGVLLYFMTEKAMDAARLERLLYRESGLLGVSEISDDMAELLASSDARALQAVDLFVYRVRREIGSLAAALDGLDALVFTGGIGENATAIRARVCADLAWLGVRLSASRNRSGGPCISDADSPVSVWVLPAREDEMIVQHTLRLLGAGVPSGSSTHCV